MANVKIPDLPLNDALTDDDLLVVEQSNGTKKVPLGSVIPDGGTAGQLLAKDSGTDYDLGWIDAPQSLPSGGTTGQVLTKQSNDDNDADWETVGNLSKYTFTPVESGADPVKVGIDMELLWANSSPSSSFAEQAVSVDMSSYSLVGIEFRRANDTSNNNCFYISPINGTEYSAISQRGGKTIYRAFTASSGGVSFAQAYFFNTYGSGAVDNTSMIPYKIYGVR